MDGVKALLEHIVKELVDNPGSVRVEEVPADDRVMYTISVEDIDVGKALGKEGRIAKAIRLIAHAVGRKYGAKVSLEIVGLPGNSGGRSAHSLDGSEPIVRSIEEIGQRAGLP